MAQRRVLCFGAGAASFDQLGDMALLDVLIAVTGCARLGNYTAPCGARYVEPPEAR